MELIGIVKASIILNMHQVTLREKAAKDLMRSNLKNL